MPNTLCHLEAIAHPTLPPTYPRPIYPWLWLVLGITIRSALQLLSSFADCTFNLVKSFTLESLIKLSHMILFSMGLCSEPLIKVRRFFFLWL